MFEQDSPGMQSVYVSIKTQISLRKQITIDLEIKYSEIWADTSIRFKEE